MIFLIGLFILGFRRIHFPLYFFMHLKAYAASLLSCPLLTCPTSSPSLFGLCELRPQSLTAFLNPLIGFGIVLDLYVLLVALHHYVIFGPSQQVLQLCRPWYLRKVSQPPKWDGSLRGRR
jgi:hypothetical protein